MRIVKSAGVTTLPAWKDTRKEGWQTVKSRPPIASADVRLWFEQASARLTVPGLETCERVAARINEVVSLGKPIAPPVSQETAKYFKLGLTHLKRDRDAVAALGATAGSMRGWDAQIAAAASALQPFLGAAATTRCRRAILPVSRRRSAFGVAIVRP